ADALEAAGIIANMNGVPNDSRPPRLTSGVRLGTAALTTRGLVEDDIHHVANFIDRAFAAVGDDATLASLRSEVSVFAGRFPMPS
ncbi:MAG: serine hydroxymethyltransferase, partial [Planctomycetota bacterium]